MPTDQKKRQYSRADVGWPVFLLTPNCIVKGETKNISLGGAFIHFLSDPVQDRFFRLLIKPPNYEGLLVVSAKVAWKSHRHEPHRILPNGMASNSPKSPAVLATFSTAYFLALSEWISVNPLVHPFIAPLLARISSWTSLLETFGVQMETPQLFSP